MYKRLYYDQVISRLKEPRKFIQIIAGARQTGKTTLIQQVEEKIGIPCQYALADVVSGVNEVWINQQWEIARLKLKDKGVKEVILIFDEIQKVYNWSETVKVNWDMDTRNKTRIKLVLLGSSPLLIQKGLTESLAGRFERIEVGHWSFLEMKKAFDFSAEEYIYFGAYPGAAILIKDEARWQNYIRDSLIETTLTKDILLLNRIDKPALLRNLFELGARYSGQILSYNKMLGQLHDAGNTTTLAHYLSLLATVGMLDGLSKFEVRQVRQKASSPKLQILNNALFSAQLEKSFDEVRSKPELWGRLVESAVGAHLINESLGTNIKVYYWRERNREVDFVLEKEDQLIAIEVKSSNRKTSLPGIAKFLELHPKTKPLLVGGGGIKVADFLAMPISALWR
jgi:uncharacterized protein